MDETLVRRLVVFSILMDTQEGILGKAPSYIMEKYSACMEIDMDFLPQLLDYSNLRKFKRWSKEWKMDG